MSIFVTYYNQGLNLQQQPPFHLSLSFLTAAKPPVKVFCTFPPPKCPWIIVHMSQHRKDSTSEQDSAVHWHAPSRMLIVTFLAKKIDGLRTAWEHICTGWKPLSIFCIPPPTECAWIIACCRRDNKVEFYSIPFYHSRHLFFHCSILKSVLLYSY